MEEVASLRSETSKTATWVDRLGVCVSIACLIHCLALPLLLAALPAFGAIYWIGDGFDLIFAVLAIVLALACLCWGFRIHRKKRLFITFGAAFLFLFSGLFYAEGLLETGLLAVGGLGLVGSHLLNRHLCRTCGTCEADSCS